MSKSPVLTRSKLILHIMVLFLLIFPAQFLLFPLPNAWAVAWYNSSWHYRKSHTITGTTAGAQTNYPMRLYVYNTTGADSGSTVHLGGNVTSSFSDIRFTSSDGTTLLDYWIEQIYSTYALVWVEVGSIPASPGTTTIYIYYGNSAASSASNGDNTFTFFDTFNDPIAPLFRNGTGWEAYSVAWGDYVRDGSIYQMFYGGLEANNGHWAIGRANTTDFKTFNRYENNPIIQNNSYTYGVSGPAILKQTDGITAVTYGGKYWMAYFDYNLTKPQIYLAYATSLTGTWTVDKKIISVGAGNAWDNSSLLSPSFVYDNTTNLYYIFYQGYNGVTWKIGWASSSTPNGTYTKSASNPVLSPTAAAWDSLHVIDPIIRKFDGTYYLFYTGQKPPPEGKNGYATSASINGSWTKYASNPILSGITGTWEEYITYPNVFKIGSTYYQQYDGHISATLTNMKSFATAPNLTTTWRRADGWLTNGLPTTSGGALLINAAGGFVKTDSNFTYDAMRAKVKLAPLASTNSYQYLGYQNSAGAAINNEEMFFTYDTPDLKVFSGNVSGSQSTSIYNASWFGSYAKYDILWASSNAKFYVDDTLKDTDAAQPVLGVAAPMGFYDYVTSAALYVDWVLDRNYVNPEPTHGAWGAAESTTLNLYVQAQDFNGNALTTATYVGYNGSHAQHVNGTGYVLFSGYNNSVFILNLNIWENSTSSNGRVKVNGSNSVTVTMGSVDKTVIIRLSVYQVSLVFRDRNSSAVTPSNMSLTFGHNSSLKTLTGFSNFYVANYSNTPSKIYKWNSNVRLNITDSFTASSWGETLQYNVKIVGRTPYWRDFNGDTVSNSHLATTYSITFPNGTLKSSLTPGTTYKMQNGSSTVTNPLWQSMNVTHGTRIFDAYSYKPNFTLRIQNHNRAPADYFGLNSSMTKFKVGSSPSYVLQNGVNISYVYDGSSVVYFNHSPVLPIVNMTVQNQTQSNLTATIQDSSASYTYQLIWVGGVGNVTTTTTTTTTTHTTTSTTSIQNIVCPTYTQNINYTFFDGFESGNFSKWNSTASGTTGTINVTSHNPINGTYSEYVNIGGNTNGFGYAVGTANLTSLGNSIWLQLYIRINPMVHSPNQEFHFLSLRNSSGAFLKMGIFHEGTEAHELEVELIDPVLGTVTLHSTDIGFDANSVQRIELGFFKNSTVGYVHAYMNGTQVINYDNIKSDYSAYNFTNFRVGAFENGAGIHHYNVTIDNVGLSNSRIGLPQYTCAFVAASYYGGNTPLGLIFVLLGMTMGAVLLIKRKRQI